jgi:hypothetical protein
MGPLAPALMQGLCLPITYSLGPGPTDLLVVKPVAIPRAPEVPLAPLPPCRDQGLPGPQLGPQQPLYLGTCLGTTPPR